jgi:hypothetical protein
MFLWQRAEEMKEISKYIYVYWVRVGVRHLAY